MLLLPPTAIAKAGDTVLVHHGHQNISPLLLVPGGVLHCKAGRFSHDSIIGQPLGRYINGLMPSSGGGPSPPQLLVLPMCATLWTQAVPHRTQIIYDTDIAVIILQLRLRPGKRVVEAGTGSGSLTHSLAKAVAPHGTVFTCDFHQARCLQAREEFRRSGLPPSLVSSHWRDVCKTSTAADVVIEEGGSEQLDDEVPPTITHLVDVEKQTEPLAGFGLPPHSVDAVFLDVPAPWLAVENVVHVLRPGGVLATFSPCVEQTQRLCDALRAAPHHFLDIRTVEAVTKQFDAVKTGSSTAGSGGRGGANHLKRDREEGREEEGPAEEEKSLLAPRLRPAAVSKGHSAYLTFARRRLPKVEEEEEEENANGGGHAAMEQPKAE